jgi:hypothetical protein
MSARKKGGHGVIVAIHGSQEAKTSCCEDDQEIRQKVIQKTKRFKKLKACM